MTQCQAGFTVIETTLFLAVSMLFLTGIVFGVQALVDNARFTDSINSLASHIQSEYESVRSGINPRDVGQDVCASSGQISAPGTTNCLLLGKVLHFNANDEGMTSYYVIGQDVDDTKLSTTEALKRSDPRIITSVSPRPYDFLWSAKLAKGRAYAPNSTEANTVMVLRSPNSSDVQVYSFRHDAFSDRESLTNFATIENLNQYDAFVMKSASMYQRVGAVCVDQGANSGAVHGVSALDRDLLKLPATDLDKNLSEVCSR